MPDKLSPPPLKAAPSENPSNRRDRGWGIAIMNQLALPGFGTVMAGRKIGYVQLCFSVAGFICITAFLFFALSHFGEVLRLRATAADDPEAALDFFSAWAPWLLTAFAGMTLWGTAWLWAWATSVKAVKDDKKSKRR